VEWRAFELHPEIPPQGRVLTRDPDRVKAGRERLLKAAAEDGVEMRFRERTSNSRLALEATEYARDQGKANGFHHALMKAYWVETRDIGDSDVLTDVAAACGLDAAELRQALTDRRYSEEVQHQIDLARQFNIYAVPSFIFSHKFLVQGCQPYDVFERIMEEHVLPDARAARGEAQSEDSAS